MDVTWWMVAEWVGSVAFALDGAWTAQRRQMDLVGITAVALAETVGGGTLRDVMLGRTPVGWLMDWKMPTMVLAVAVLVAVGPAALIATKHWRRLHATLDAIGLGLFAVVGASIAHQAGCSFIACAMLGTVSGAFGGVLRDIFCAEVPAIFQRTPLYATSAMVGTIVYLGLTHVGLPAPAAIAGIITAIGIRLAALRWNWRLPC